MDQEPEGQERTVGQIIGDDIDGRKKSKRFNLYSMTCDFADPIQFKSGKEVRKLALAMLEGNTKVRGHVVTSMFPGGPIGLMQFTQSMVRTRMTDPNFRLRLNDVESLLDGQMVIALPLNNMDLQGSTITPNELRQADLSDTNAEGVEIKAHIVDDIRTNANTNLRNAKIEADGIIDLKLAPGADCRGIEIKPGRTYMGTDWTLKADIEGAMLQGARLPADLSEVKGAQALHTQYSSDPKRYLVNAGDGVMINGMYGGNLETVGEMFDYAINRSFYESDGDKKKVFLLNEVAKAVTSGFAKDWPMAAQARQDIRDVLDNAQTNGGPLADKRLRQLNELGISVPPDSELSLASQDPTIVRPAAFAARQNQ